MLAPTPPEVTTRHPPTDKDSCYPQRQQHRQPPRVPPWRRPRAEQRRTGHNNHRDGHGPEQLFRARAEVQRVDQVVLLGAE